MTLIISSVSFSEFPIASYNRPVQRPAALCGEDQRAGRRAAQLTRQLLAFSRKQVPPPTG